MRSDGSRFWANVVVTALRDENGALVGFAKVTRDLTERRDSERRALDDARRLAAAEAANRARSEFLTTLSHELRTPLNAIGGYAELLEMGVAGPLAEPQREYVARIRGSQTHLLALIDTLLSYGRIEAGRVHYEPRRARLRDIVARAVAMVLPQAALRGISIAHGAGDDVIAVVDESKAEQIVINLLSNAAKYSTAGGRVVVTCGSDGRHALVSVADGGPGIAAEQHGAIFEPFVQLDRTLTTRHQGAGLGLAICRELARGMGGDVTVESAAGSGSTFTFTMPAGA